MHDAETSVDRSGRGLDLQRGRAREDAAGHGGVEHPPSHEARVQRLVPRAAAGEHADLIGAVVVGADDEARLAVPAHERAVGALESLQGLVYDLPRVVDEVAPGTRAVGAVGHLKRSSFRASRTPIDGLSCRKRYMIGEP